MPEVTLGIGHGFLRDKIREVQAADHTEAFLDVDAQPRTHIGAGTSASREVGGGQAGRGVLGISLNERGLASTSGVAYAAITHRFLTRTCPRGRSDLKALTALRIRDFATHEAGKFRTSKAASLLTCVVRSFLRFVHYRGYVDRSLVRSRSRGGPLVDGADSESTADQGMSVEFSQRASRGVLPAVFAIAPFCCSWHDWVFELGRSCSSNWMILIGRPRAFMSVARGRQERPLPLPHDVGEAIAAYLRNGRRHRPAAKFPATARAVARCGEFLLDIRDCRPRP